MPLPREKSVPSHTQRYFVAQVFENNEGIYSMKFRAGDEVRTWLKNNFNVGEDISVLITDKKPSRTKRQNALYWVYLADVARETGHTAADLHEFFKWKFIPPEAINIYGENIYKSNSTTKLKISAFAEYMDSIAEFTGIQLPSRESFGLRELPYRGKENT